MTTTTHYDDYDVLALIYNEDWISGLFQETIPVLEKLLLTRLTKGSHILDLCCGTGHLAQQLLQKGYQITGIDGSEQMLHYARENAPEARFILDDARFFNLPATFDAVVSTTGSLNYVMKIEELKRVLKNVSNALIENGIFLCHFFTQEEFQSNWNGKISGNVKDDYAWATKNIYNPDTKIGQMSLTVFSLVDESWQRLDKVISEKCYDKEEIIFALETAGFSEISFYDAHYDLGISQMPGSTYFICYKRVNI
ncbi:class I SAM-dependent DNA methyltransferase [Calothrix sp. NIES-2098]|uniref:class I SAM-dependent DNA methyltransferase n=1 Tax=Calothrix sp. NIES-2098 TaxID=1954171 RepID=UPI000B5E18C6|nr:type 12 methyltransferase [Calothrix sp. NIES-2098]